MRWRHFIIGAAPALALAAVLVVAGPSYARGGHGGGGHGGGGFHGGGFHGGGFHGGGWGGRGFYGRGYGGYGGYRGYGYRGYGYGGYYPGFYGGFGYYPYYYGGYGSGYGYYPSYYNYNSYPYYNYYPNAAYSGAPANYYQSMYPAATVAAQAPNTVRVNVHVPVANAKVWIDSTLTQQSGTNRVFESPALTPGSTYSYTLRAQWMQNGTPVEQSRTVQFRPGEQVAVNFTTPS